SPRRFSARRLAARWVKCGGLNEPPNSPIFMPGACGGRRGAFFVPARACDFTRFTSPACGGELAPDLIRGRRRDATAAGGPPPPPSPARGGGRRKRRIISIGRIARPGSRAGLA